jgi:Calcineurin-like phosphoesterase
MGSVNIDLFSSSMSFKKNHFYVFIVTLLSFGLSTLGIFVTHTFGATQTNQSDFNFAAAGDFGCGKNANRTIINMVDTQPEVVIGLGDLSYQKTADCWFDLVSPLDTDGRLKIAIGDNEMFPAKYSDYMKHFKMDSPFYSFDYGNVHFLSMATAKNKVIPYNETSEQYEFVKDDLKRAHQNKSINWIIVYSFRPFYSSNTTHPALDELQDLYHPLFDQYGVDIVLQAHNHNYQRTYPLTYNLAKPIAPIITDKETSKYRPDPKGPIFVTVGTGGADLYGFTGQAPYVITQFLRHGFLNVDISENGRKLNATFYEKRENTDKDQFTIIK